MKNLMIFAAIAAASACQAQVVFYGGDFDDRNGLLSSSLAGDDAIVYDDFTITQGTTVTSVFGNFQLEGFAYTSANWEIRSGVSEGNGGALLHFGTGATSSIATNRTAFGDPEFQVTVAGLSAFLNPGTYHLGIALNMQAARSYMSTTSGLDVATAGDPNPAPTGGPIANGNSFISSTQFALNFTNVSNVFGAGTWDFSYGVAGVVPEPSTFVALGAALVGLVALRRRK